MGFWEKLKKIYMGDVFGSAISEADEAFFDDLEEMLILADVGLTASTEAVQELRQRMIEDKISGPEPVKACLRKFWRKNPAWAAPPWTSPPVPP